MKLYMEKSRKNRWVS